MDQNRTSQFLHVELPMDVVHEAELTVGEARLALAIQLYADGRIDHAQARRVADVRAGVLDRALAARNLSVVVYPMIAPWRQRRAG
jgi:predicted HTH domain antitoxin